MMKRLILPQLVAIAVPTAVNIINSVLESVTKKLIYILTLLNKRLATKLLIKIYI